MDRLFDLLRVRQPAWDEAGRLVLSPRKAGEGPGAAGASSEGLRTNLVDQYSSVVLLVLLEVGLVEVSGRGFLSWRGRRRGLTWLYAGQTLAAVASEETDAVMRRKVAYLISEVLQLANRVLPPAYATQVQVSTALLVITFMPQRG